MADLIATNKHAINTLEESKRHELEALRRQLTQSSDAQAVAILKAHANEVSTLKKLRETTIRELEERYANEKTASTEVASFTLAKSLADLEAKLNKEKMGELAEQRRENEMATSQLQDDHDRKVSMMDQMLVEVRGQLQDASNQCTSLNQSIAR